MDQAVESIRFRGDWYVDGEPQGFASSCGKNPAFWIQVSSPHGCMSPEDPPLLAECPRGSSGCPLCLPVLPHAKARRALGRYAARRPAWLPSSPQS